MRWARRVGRRHTGRVLLAYVVALVHAVAVVLMLTGGLLALRWRRLVPAHLPVLLAIVAVNLVGADCPLTSLELALRARAGGEVYGNGFLGHYVLGPLDVDGDGAAAQVAQRLLSVVPNAVAYELLAARWRRRPAPVPAVASAR